MVTNEFAEASAEIIEILKYLSESEIERIPLKLRNFLKEVADKEHIICIEPNTPLEKQDLKEKTKNLLAILYRNYWCTEDEKKELDKRLLENDKIYEQKLREKYNPDKIFKEDKLNSNIIETNAETELIVYEEKWYKKAWDRIIRKIKQFVKRK